jgi:hypothetical protein
MLQNKEKRKAMRKFFYLHPRTMFNGLMSKNISSHIQWLWDTLTRVNKKIEAWHIKNNLHKSVDYFVEIVVILLFIFVALPISIIWAILKSAIAR